MRRSEYADLMLPGTATQGYILSQAAKACPRGVCDAGKRFHALVFPNFQNQQQVLIQQTATGIIHLTYPL